MSAQKPPRAARRLVIGIEAATPAAGVALATVEGELLAQIWADSPLPASRRLLDELAGLMRDFNVQPGQVEAIACSHGPGAFTGLRVGLTQAKTLAHTWGCRLYGFSTLAMMARRWPVAGAIVCPLLDARRGEVYSGLYRALTPDAPEPERLREDRVESVETLIESLQACAAPRIWLAGSGARQYRAPLEAALGERAGWCPVPLDDPAADALALAGAAALRAGRPGIEPLAAGPVYLRASDAETRHGIFADIPLTEAPAP